MMFVKGEPYRTNLPGTMQLRVMREVQRQFGFSWAYALKHIKSLDTDGDMWELMAEDEFLAWVWAWMRNAGSDVTVEELEQFAVDDITFGPDRAKADDAETTGEGASSPTPAPSSSSKASAPGGSSRAGAGKAAKAAQSRKRSGTRSKTPSGNASS